MSRIFLPALAAILAFALPVMAQDAAPGPSPSPAPSPSSKANLVPLPNPSDFPNAEPAAQGQSQQQIEQSVIPDEPMLQEPDANATPYPAEQVMRELQEPQPDATPEGPSLEDTAKTKVAFRKLVTQVQLDPELQALRAKAFGMKTEVAKRAWLREYYREYANKISKLRTLVEGGSVWNAQTSENRKRMENLQPALDASASSWNTKHQNSLARPRTEEGKLPSGAAIKYPGGYANRKAIRAAQAAATPTPSESILPEASATPQPQ